MKKNFKIQDWNDRLFAETERIAGGLTSLFKQAVYEAARIAITLPVDAQTPFSFDDFPTAALRVDALMQMLARSMQSLIETGQESAWLLAGEKTDALIESIAVSSSLPPDRLRGYGSRNLEALAAFQARKSSGLNLSDRVWNYTGQFKQEIELGLDLGIGEGQSADQISQGLRAYLNKPEQLFRRVRSKRGSLILSKAANAFHPGQGVYRSSYKNALRLARTEVNMAYREADHLRYQQLDFVVGIEVRRSNNPYPCDLCEPLKGQYPKTFRFSGWHPNCRCYVVSILATPHELDLLNERVLSGTDSPAFRSVNEVTDFPVGYKDWINQHKERLSTGRVPYFIQQNYKGGQIEKGLQIALPKPNYLPRFLDTYEQQHSGVVINREIFSLLNSPIPLRQYSSSGAHFSPSKGYVSIPNAARYQHSPWWAEGVVYHEYGHAIDWQHALKDSPEVKALMEKYRKAFSAKGDALYKSLTLSLSKQHSKAFFNQMFDEEEQIGSALDTLMALNVNYGDGHTRDYYAKAGYPEAEFIAHAFTNYFKGNPVFERVMPGLYADMRKLVARWIKQFG